MKRKTRIIVGVVIGVLVLLFIIVGPAAPLWARLGVKPVCVQGEWPHLRLVSCEETAAAPPTVTPLPLPSLNGQAPIPIIVDDDGSPDGVIALLYFLNNPLFDVRAVTISSGEAHPSLFAPHLLQLLAGVGRDDVPVGAGRDTPLEGNNAFPDPWRQASDNFWEIDLPTASVTLEPVPAAELIVDTVNRLSATCVDLHQRHAYQPCRGAASSTQELAITSGMSLSWAGAFMCRAISIAIGQKLIIRSPSGTSGLTLSRPRKCSRLACRST